MIEQCDIKHPKSLFNIYSLLDVCSPWLNISGWMIMHQNHSGTERIYRNLADNLLVNDGRIQPTGTNLVPACDPVRFIGQDDETRLIDVYVIGEEIPCEIIRIPRCHNLDALHLILGASQSIFLCFHT